MISKGSASTSKTNELIWNGHSTPIATICQLEATNYKVNGSAGIKYH